MKNHFMMEYGFNEGKDFVGIMPEAAKNMGTIGASDVVVKMHGIEAKGSDALEVIDIQSAFNEKSEDSEGEEEGEEGEHLIPDFSQSEVILTNGYEPKTPIIISGVNTTVDLNGNSILAPVFSESNGEVIEGNTDSYGFWVKDGSLTIEGEGEIIAQDAKYSMAVWANGGDVIIKSGIFRNGGDSCDLIYASNGSTITIKGGKFIPSGPASGNEPGTKNLYTALNVKDIDYKNGKSKIIVEGGKFYNFNPGNNLSEGEGTNFVAPGYKSVETEPGSNIWEVIPE